MGRKRTTKPKAAPVPAATPTATAFSAARSAWVRFHDVKHEFVRLHLWTISAVSLLQPWAVGWFETNGTLPTGTWAFYAAVLKTTAPLTITLSVWAVMLVVCWPESDSDQFGYLMLMALAGGLMLTVSARIGNALGANEVKLVEPIHVFGPVNGLLNALASYLFAYRGAMFTSSMGIAAYSGFVALRFLRKSEPAAVSDQVDQPPRKNRAA